MKLSISGKAKIALLLIAVFIVFLLSLLFTKTVAMAWTIIKILPIVITILAAIYYIKWGNK